MRLSPFASNVGSRNAGDWLALDAPAHKAVDDVLLRGDEEDHHRKEHDDGERHEGRPVDGELAKAAG